MTSIDSKRIAKNTLLLYLRMLFTMGVNLYTSRVVLEALGAIDFGLYSVIGGFVSMFSVFSASLTAAISRFITFELGKKDIKEVQRVFSTSVLIQFIISLIILILAETLGVWLLNIKMTIPMERVFAANVVFHISVITFIINLWSVPYNALIVAHEKMSAFAYIGVFQAIATLLIAYAINKTTIDSLILYSILLALLAIIIRLLYGFYCKISFSESKLIWTFDKKKIIEIFGFAGWNFVGSISGILRDQGVNLLLNVFYGPMVNAARGIAMQVSGAISSFSNNFMIALNPQITKNYALGEMRKMNLLVFRGTRFSAFLLFILSFPVLLETRTILSLWLVQVPDYTVIFVRLILIQILIDSLSNTLVTVMLATGDIKKYQLIVGGCILLNFPLSFCLLKIGFEPEVTLFVSILLSILAMFLRLKMLCSMILFPMKDFLIDVVGKVGLVALAALPFPVFITYIVADSYTRCFTNIFLTMITTGVSVYYLGCLNYERDYLKGKFSSLIDKLIK